MVRRILGLFLPALALGLGLGLGLGRVAAAEDGGWAAVERAARGQTVYWNAWGGDEKINAYMAWAAEQIQRHHGVTVRLVKVTDTAEVVARVLAERTAGRVTDGSVDLVWINGENFAAMKQAGLLFGPFTQRLPAMALVDATDPTITHDFTVPVEGLEAPWGRAQLVFVYDSARLPDPPRSLGALGAWAKANPGRFTYPEPPDFTGSTFLKQALYELAPDRSVLARPAAEPVFSRTTAPLWAWLEELRPHLWRQGMVYPRNAPALRQLLDDGEVEFAMTFHPAEPSADIAQGLLPPTARSFVLEGGTIGNVHFLAIPFNARAPEGAQVAINFLMSPEAQARKQDAAVWGDDTILDLGRLPPAERARFQALDPGPATVPPHLRGTPLPEPHPSWMERLEEEWRRRHAAGR